MQRFVHRYAVLDLFRRILIFCSINFTISSSFPRPSSSAQLRLRRPTHLFSVFARAHRDDTKTALFVPHFLLRGLSSRNAAEENRAVRIEMVLRQTQSGGTAQSSRRAPSSVCPRPHRRINFFRGAALIFRRVFRLVRPRPSIQMQGNALTPVIVVRCFILQ